MSKPLPRLSVIIPTADRQHFAEITAAAAHALSDDIEVVVADSSVGDGLETQLAAQIATGRLVYRRVRAGIDVVSNFEGAIDAASGDYLIFIGDDDFLGPGIMDVVQWMAAGDVESVLSYGNSFLASYFWPGVQSRFFGEGYAGKLFVYPFDGQARRIDPIAALKDALRNFGSGLGLMPRAYHGIVARGLVDRIRQKYGRLFGGVSPDIFSATLISAETRSAWQVMYPFCVPGASPKSTAGLGAARTDRAGLRDNPHIAPFEDLIWDPAIPEFYSPTTVWSYSFKQAVDLLDSADLKPNMARLYARCLIAYGAYRSETVAAIGARRDRENGALLWLQIVGEIGQEIARQGGRVAKRLTRPSARGFAIADYSGLADVVAARAALVEHLGRSGPSLRLPAA